MALGDMEAKAQEQVEKSGLKKRETESGDLKPLLIRIGENDIKRLKTHFKKERIKNVLRVEDGN
ncbi:MAG TPA: hypothetical protein ENH82_04405 [bacterium]|nr:hypothetical protein [bacterium]